MIGDPDIFHAAKLLIDQHGADAPIRAAQRAEELLHDGNGLVLRSGARSWRRSRKYARLGAR
jgi:hypothetical protein